MLFGIEAVVLRPPSPPTISLLVCLALLPILSLGSNVDSKEVYLNGSAYLRLFTPMPIWGHSAISLRSCRGGEILTQRYNRQQLQLTVSKDNVTVSLDVPQKSVQAIIPERLLDNKWHTIEFLYQYGNLHLIIDHKSTIIANSTYNSLFLTNQEVKNEAAVLILGNKYSGCLLHGPGLIFNSSAIHAQGVEFGPCPMAPGPCGDIDVISPVVIDHCRNYPCMKYGTCLSKQDGYECHCTPRYAGKNCEVDTGPPCASQPCQHGGVCVEDLRGDFQCNCPSKYVGRYCEIEISVHPLCEKNPCLNNGTCRVPPGGKNFECDCILGFSGSRCETDLNDCESQPCQHNGRCVDEIGKFSCDCSNTGYAGPLCQDNVDECLMNPCLNNGVCFDTYGSYICDCPPGYGGKNCSDEINNCLLQPCQHGGSCKEVKGSFECICQQGYSGLFCEQGPPCPSCPIDSECVGGQCVCKPGSTGLIGYCVPTETPKSDESNACSSLCRNGATCLGTVSNFTCVCASGFTGLHCEYPSASAFQEDCPCMNGGSCLPNQTCLCRPGFEGSRCERIEICSSANCPEPMVCFGGACICPENMNCDLPCHSSPCQNNGTCRNKGDNYECLCTEGWTGTNCEQDIDECASLPTCGNGICINNKGSFRCYCEPGYTGVRCDTDVDECLSLPCKNGATCINKINDYECTCLPGYTGKVCDIDIDECATNPCSKGSTCIDSIANFTCVCMPGMTGQLCEIDIDDCESQPCLNGGRCIDKLDGFECNCSSTGYTGDVCQINIDECQSNPCENGARCVDMINDYQCTCFPGYTGKNCETDIDECESSPCQYNGQCLEKSNMTLYKLYNQPDGMKHNLPASFAQPFSYENASGYECVCVPGITGKNCETNINECDSNPCSKYGTCNDGVGTYTCECEPGFEGLQCEKEIDECDKYMPCEHGTCIDQRDDYTCDCDSMYGGKNCSVLLTGCANSPCMHDGTCKPYLVNETDHKFNCTCPHGYQGAICDKITTMSLVKSSLITVHTNRDEGYDINLEFKTTLPNGILAFGTGNAYSYILELVNGRLNLHSSLLNKWEGVFIGSGLNDSKWQRVFVAINSSHLVLSANEEQTIYPINSYEGTNGSHTTFPDTYLGGTIPNLSSYLRHLTHNPSSFVGCMQDVVINGQWVFPNETVEPVKLVNVETECPREEQCKKDPCNSNGECKDLWYTFSCTCHRPHLGRTCKFTATFGHENTTRTAVIVKTSDSAKRAIRSILDISMFIRTRQSSGQVFYLGSDPNKDNTNVGTGSDSFVSAKLHGGELLVKIKFTGTPEAYTVGGNKLDNGYNHLIQVVRNLTLVQVKLNGTEYFRKTLSSTGQLDAEVLYLGGPPPGLDGAELNLSKEEQDKIYFKGIIQDVQVSNGSHAMAVQFYPLNETEVTIPPPFGEVVIDTTSVLKGEVSDDLCRQQPCLHGAECKNTWNDIECTCPRGYKGKYCQDIQFCELNKCPGEGVCQNLDDGFECITNMTFQGNEENPLSFAFYPRDPLLQEMTPLKPTIEISYRTKTGGTLLYVQDGEMYFEIAVYKDQVTLQWKLSSDLPETHRFHKEETTFDWNRIYIRMQDNMLDAGWKGWEESTDQSPLIATRIDGNAFLQLFSGENMIYLGGMPATEANQITKGPNSGAIFKGCLGEARVGDLLLPYFPYLDVYSDNVQNRSLFKLNNTRPEEGCILCFEQDCKNSGHCKNPSEEYACECSPGYEGDDCSLNIDECLTANCTNNSTCIDGIASYSCVCLPGYEGDLCEYEINECLSMPCHNGGACTDLVAGFSCNCTEEYAGPQCDILKLVTCDNNPCHNGSTCLDGYNSTTGNNFTCVCMPGLQGPFCDMPFCKVQPCKNGFCLSGEPLQPPKCQCSIGYTGKYCEIEINECESQPCQNNGQCIDSIGSFECNCTNTGFNGVLCENDIDECVMERISCGGKGLCINTRGSFKCQCPEDTCGPNCDQVDMCAYSDICQNGGVCIEDCKEFESDYICNCTEEFTGKNCTESAALQESSPTDIAIIVVPVVVVLLAIGGALLGAFIVMARNKRATRGTYSPSAQEYCNPRLEMDNVLKPPPEERLI
ncbi:protein crumbs isoform X2 [Hermetia illucens]|uniref:protein crumbs isoform X2 n=1 Tax=Hermetia illucens TaxID=343691 RepID=UPI0018CC7775|nr:protein crumbs isoform X2 [Hermetia illucens]